MDEVIFGRYQFRLCRNDIEDTAVPCPYNIILGRYRGHGSAVSLQYFLGRYRGHGSAVSLQYFLGRDTALPCPDFYLQPSSIIIMC